MVDGGKEVGLADRHPQHRHLQPCKPDTDRGGNALFCQDALEQQGHDLDRGAFGWRGGGLLELLLALVQLFEQGGRADRAGCQGRSASTGQAPVDALLRFGNGGLEFGRSRPGLRGDGEFGKLPADQPVESPEHRLGVVGTARQADRARHHPRLFSHVGAPAARTHHAGVAEVGTSARTPSRAAARDATHATEIRSGVLGAPDERTQIGVR